jgi:hypothetical protein
MEGSIRLAVLIDAENVSHRLADRVFEMVEPLGTTSVRRIYGNFNGPARSWADAAARHALEATHCFAPATGKNGADIALTVGAMDLLRDGAVDGFCIVSSDGDFAALVRRVRGGGRLAFGIGRSMTKASYRDACSQFLLLDEPLAAEALPEPNAALASIWKALGDCVHRDGWYNLCDFGNAAKRAGINTKDHGVTKLAQLLKNTGQFTFADSQRFRPNATLRVIAGGQ